MGAWGAGSFENDAALDFLNGLEQVEQLAAAFERVAGDEEAEADPASEALAAADIVAAMMGRPAADAPDRVQELATRFGAPTADIRMAARDAVSKVIARSELADLWADDAADFNRANTSLIDRLNPEKPHKPEATGQSGGGAVCQFCNEVIQGRTMMVSVSELGGDNSMKISHFAHLECLNAALHPRHIIQRWEFDDAEIDELARRLLE